MQIGLFPDDLDKSLNLIRKIRPISIIIMGTEYKTLEELNSILIAIKNLYKHELGLEEPLIAVDQEGGNVARIREINYPPGNYLLGKLDDPSITRYAGKITGYELKKLGFHWNLAPVLDVRNNTDNYIVMERSFGDDPMKVAVHGVQFILGLQEYGIAATAKHFPGHGSVMEDSHVTLPRDRRSLPSIMNTILPFTEAIRNGVDSIMMTHIIFEAYDADFPASLSHKWYSFLRNDLRFSGTIISDSMDMKAISNNFSPREIAKLAFDDGADIIECVDPTLALEIFENLEKIDSDNSSRIHRIEKMFISPKYNYAPPGEIMEWISVLGTSWIHELKLDPERGIQIMNLSPAKYMRQILERIGRDLLNLGIDVITDDEAVKSDQVIIVGKNLHINGKFKIINDECRDRKCVYLCTGVPVDTGVLDRRIGFISSSGDKYENIKASFYKILGFF